MTTSEKLKKVSKRVLKILLTLVLVIIGIVLLVVILIQTGPVQNFGRRKIEAYLENKLHSKVRIGNLYIGFPSRIILKNIYLEDKRKDTLLSGGKIEVDIAMFGLLHKEINISSVELDQVTVKVKRMMPDSVFNFQFIADAFNSGPEKPKQEPDKSAGFKFVIGTIHLHDIRAVYSDDATGNNLNVRLGDFKTKIKTFDPKQHIFAVPTIVFSDISGQIHQYKPILILQKTLDTINVQNQKSAPIHLELGTIDLSRISLAFRSDADNMNADIKLGSFHTTADSIDLATSRIRLKQIALNNTDAIVHFGRLAANKLGKPLPVKDTMAKAGTWSLDIAGFTIDSTHLQYDDDNKTALKKGMDYSHMNVNHLTVHTEDLHADPQNYKAIISAISFDEKSGFVLKRLSAKLDYAATGTRVQDFILVTGNSEIRNQTSVRYSSLAELKDHPGNIETNILFDRSRIGIKDVLIFVPSLEEPLKGNKQSVIALNGKVAGRLKDLHIPYLEISGIGKTVIAASGDIRGLPDSSN